MDKLQKYDFVMRRRGGWQAEIERLKAEATRHQRNAERVLAAFRSGCTRTCASVLAELTWWHMVTETTQENDVWCSFEVEQLIIRSLEIVPVQGAKSVEKSKGLLARTQEKRKRAEDKAAQHPKKTCAVYIPGAVVMANTAVYLYCPEPGCY